jgi:hypothetical protein
MRRFPAFRGRALLQESETVASKDADPKAAARIRKDG